MKWLIVVMMVAVVGCGDTSPQKKSFDVEGGRIVVLTSGTWHDVLVANALTNIQDENPDYSIQDFETEVTSHGNCKSIKVILKKKVSSAESK